MVETRKKYQDTITGVDFVIVNYKDLIEKEGDEDKDKISINPIYFEHDKSDITPQAAKELDKVVYTLENFPKIKIESHTDSRGTDSYNLKLSNERAKSTEKYIVEQRGVDQEQIISVAGFGETRLLNKCSNGVKYLEEEHELNRKSNFIVLEK